MATSPSIDESSYLPSYTPSYRPAQYLLRFDDLCPTHSRANWAAFQALIEEFGLKPILAIVPDNRDPGLMIDSPDPDFWRSMRALEAAGAAIALHGYRHLCRSRGRSLIPLHRETEFAGVGAETQREWIAAGLVILRDHGLNPCVWVAPRHGFDRASLAALRSEGIGALSDGFASVPFTRHGLTWIPQQLWAPVEKRRGLWTICLHGNTAGPGTLSQLRDFLREHASQFTSVENVLAQALPSAQAPLERVISQLAVFRIRLRRMKAG
jgi:predicted deacetylase